MLVILNVICSEQKFFPFIGIHGSCAHCNMISKIRFIWIILKTIITCHTQRLTRRALFHWARWTQWETVYDKLYLLENLLFSMWVCVFQFSRAWFSSSFLRAYLANPPAVSNSSKLASKSNTTSSSPSKSFGLNAESLVLISIVMGFLP